MFFFIIPLWTEFETLKSYDNETYVVRSTTALDSTCTFHSFEKYMLVYYMEPGHHFLFPEN